MSKMLKHCEIFQETQHRLLKKERGERGDGTGGEEEVSTEHHHPGDERMYCWLRTRGPQRTNDQMTIRILPLKPSHFDFIPN